MAYTRPKAFLRDFPKGLCGIRPMLSTPLGPSRGTREAVGLLGGYPGQEGLLTPMQAHWRAPQLGDSLQGQ